MSTLFAINDLGRHNRAIQADLEEAVTRLVRSGWYVLGTEVSGFEQVFARYCGVASVIGVANGTDALELSLRSVGVERGRKVALVANAGGYGTIAVNAVGAEPVYVDVDPTTYGMDAASLEAALRGGDVHAVVVTHLYGQLAAIEEISAVARRYGVRLVEDCAQAHGARRGGTMAGSWGDVATFSFYPTKNLGALGDGGAVATNDEQIAASIRQLRQYGWDQKYRSTVAYGRNSRLDEVQAAVLTAKLSYLDGWNSRRVQIASRYNKMIDHPGITLPRDPGPDHVAHLYVVRCSDRESLAQHMKAAKIPYDIHYPIPDHQQPMFGGRFSDVALPVTERICHEVLTLPCFPEMTDDEVDEVAGVVNQWRP
jgi:dTDP-4-amino-4,6-dideoxygalactose transaminase